MILLASAFELDPQMPYRPAMSTAEAALVPLAMSIHPHGRKPHGNVHIESFL